MQNDPLQQNQVYAKIDGLTIVEYPVSLLHIQNRGEPLEWYTPVIFDPKPVVPAFHYAREIPTVIDGTVKVSYQIESLTLSDVLRLINPNTSPMPGMHSAPVLIADVTPEALARITELTTQYVQDKLDAFAQTKGYDSLISVASYKNSTVVNFAAEATAAIALRDQVWTALHTYLDAVVAGTQPVPQTVAEIEAQLPAFAWV